MASRARQPAGPQARALRSARGLHERGPRRADLHRRQAQPVFDRRQRHLLGYQHRERPLRQRWGQPLLLPRVRPLVPGALAPGAVELRDKRPARGLQADPARPRARRGAPVRAGDAAGRGGAAAGADPAEGHHPDRAAGRRGKRPLRGRAAVRAHRRHGTVLRDQHAERRRQGRRPLLPVLPGSLVPRTLVPRSLGGGAPRSRGDLHDPAEQPDLPRDLRPRVRLGPGHRDRRGDVGLQQRPLPLRRGRLRHGLLLPEILVLGHVLLPRVLGLPVLLRLPRLLQPVYRNLWSRRRRLRPLRGHRSRSGLQPEHRDLRARRYGLGAGPEAELGRGLQPENGDRGGASLGQRPLLELGQQRGQARRRLGARRPLHGQSRNGSGLPHLRGHGRHCRARRRGQRLHPPRQ